MSPKGCPPVDQYRALLQGKLPEDAVESLARHVENCPSCAGTVATLGHDTLADALRSGAAGIPANEEAPLENLLRRTQAMLAPASDLTIDSTAEGAAPSLVANPNETLAIVGKPEIGDEIRRLGVYRILRQLGQGGMGMVFEAEDTKLERRVALKVMKPEIAKVDQHRERFLREARTAAKVESDFICPIFQVGEENGIPFIAMPFLKGEPLDARLRQGVRMPIADVVRIGREVAEGLSAAHDAGLIHRDIKPANIWLETQRNGPPRARILDFGLARAQADDVHITQSGAILGTPAYMSPEQARGDKNVDARSDLFSLGSMLYSLCSGDIPFKAETTMGVLTALAVHNPTPPHEISQAIPRPLSELIMQLLAKDANRRPASAHDVIARLADIERSLSAPQIAPVVPLATPVSLAAAAPPRRRSRLGVVLAGGLFAGLCALLGGVFYFQTNNGIIEIQTEDKNIKIIVEQNGETVTVLDPVSKQSYVINTGKYTVRLADNPDGLEIVLPDTFEMRRGGKQVVTVRKIAGPVAIAGGKQGGRKEGKQEEKTDTTPITPALQARTPLDALRRADIPPQELLTAGRGDPAKAPAELVGVLGDGRLRGWPGGSGAPRGLAFSPDSKRIAVGDANFGPQTQVRIFNVATGNLETILANLPGNPETLAWHPREDKLLITGTGGLWGVWDLPTRKQWVAFQTDHVGGAAFLDGGRQILLSEIGRLPRIVDAATGKDIREFTGDPQPGHSAVLSSNEKLLLTNIFQHKQIRVWDVATGKETQRFDDVGKVEFSLSYWHPNVQSFFFVGGGGPGGGAAVEFFLAEKKRVPVQMRGGMFDISPDGRWILNVDRDFVSLLDATTHKEAKRLFSPDYDLRGWRGVFSPNNEYAAIIESPHSVNIWKIADGSHLRPKAGGLESPPGVLKVSDDGRRLLLGTRPTGQGKIGVKPNYEIVDLETKRSLWQGESDNVFDGMSSDGKRFAGWKRGTAPQELAVWDVDTGRPIAVLPYEQPDFRGRSCQFLPGERKLAIMLPDKLVVWDLDAKKETLRIPLGKTEEPRFVVANSVPRLVTLTRVDKVTTCRVWDTVTGKEIRSFDLEISPRLAVINADATRLYISENGPAFMLDLTTGKTQKLPNNYPEAFAFSPTEKVVAMISRGQSPQIVQLVLSERDTGKTIRTIDLPGHVASVTFSPDGRHLLVGNGNGTVSVYRLAEANAAPGTLAPNAFVLQSSGASKVALPREITDKSTSYTLEGWFLIQEDSATGNTSLIGSGEPFLGFKRKEGQFYYAPGNTKPLEAIESSRQRWTHVASVSEGKQNRLYVDGKLVATDIADQERILKLTPHLGMALAGKMKEIRISKVARYGKGFTPAPRFEPDADTLALYHCDEGTGDKLTDSSGNGHHGTIVGAKWVKADGAPIASATAALNLQGQATVSFPTLKHLPTQGDLTIEGFVVMRKPFFFKDTQTVADIGGRFIGETVNAWVGMSKGKWAGYVFHKVMESNKEMVIGEQTHIAVVRTPTQSRLYVNGKLENTHDGPGVRIEKNEFDFGLSASFNSIEISKVRISTVARYLGDKEFTPAARFEPDKETLALYHCDEGQGDKLTDSSGNGHHGKIFDGAKWVKADGAPLKSQRYALEFTDDNPSRPQAFYSNMSIDRAKPFTVEGYFTVTSPKGRSTLGLFDVTGAPRFHYVPVWTWGYEHVGGKKPITQVRSTVEPVLNRRIHLAGVRTADKLLLFVEGKLLGSADVLPGTLTGKGFVAFGSTLIGTMDQVRISSVARYDKDFTPPPELTAEPGTESLYLFKEGKGDTVEDASGNGHHGKIVGAKWVKVDGAAVAPPPVTPDFALAFDGQGGFKIPIAKYERSKPLTVEAWVIPGKMKEINASHFFLNVGECASLAISPERDWGFAGRETSEKISFQIGSFPLKPQMKRTHVAGVRDAKEVRLYVDGLLVKKKTLDAPILGFDDFLTVGTHQRNFVGVLDEIRVSSIVRYTKDFTPSDRFDPDGDTLALYHCDEGNGDFLKDSSGNGNHGKIVGAKWVKTDGTATAPVNNAPRWPLAPTPAGEIKFFADLGVYMKVRDGANGDHEIRPGGELPKKPVTVVGASFWDADASKVNDAVLRRLAKLTDIEFLGYNFNKYQGVSVTTDGGRELGALVNLRHLAVAHFFKGGFDGSVLAKMPHLENLDVADIPGSVWVKNIAGAKGLREISTYRVPISEAELDQLAKLPNLTKLQLHNPGVSDDVLKAFAKKTPRCKVISGMLIIEPSAPAPGTPQAFALAFDGKSHVNIPSLSREENSPITVEAGVTLDNLRGGVIVRLFGDKGCQLYGWPDANKSRWIPNVIDGGGKFTGDAPGLEVGRRYHLAMQLDGTRAEIFLDGKKIREEKRTPGSLNDPIRATILGSDSTTGKNGIIGKLDNVRISKGFRYSSNFTPATRFVPDKETLALYHMDEGAGDKLTDSSGNGHHGTIVGAKWVKAEGTLAAGNAVYLDDVPETLYDGSGSLGKHGKNFKGEPIVWKEEKLAHALFIHPKANTLYAAVEYDLGGRFDNFTAQVGLTLIPNRKLTFCVKGDGQTLWELTDYDTPFVKNNVAVSVRDVKVLRLEVTGGFSNAGTTWLNPQVTQRSAKEMKTSTLRFDNSSAVKNEVTVPTLLQAAATPLCIEGFVTITKADAERQDAFGFPWEFEVFCREPTASWQVHGRFDGANGAFSAESKHKHEVGKQHHLAAVLDGKKIRFYIDGKRVAETLASNDPQRGKQSFVIGRRLNGHLSEVRVSKVARYDKDFTPAQRHEPDADTLALYHMDEGAGDKLTDSSGNGHHGKIVGAKWVKAEAAPGESGKPQASSRIKPGDGAIELLPLIDLARDKRVGTWKINPKGDVGTVAQADGDYHLQLPLSVKGDYRLKVEFTHHDPNMEVVALVFPVGPAQAEAAIGSNNNNRAGFGSIDGQPFNENPTTRRKMGFVKDKRNSVTIEVRAEAGDFRVTAIWNSDRFVDWAGPASRLTVPEPRASADRSLPGLWLSQRCSNTEFHSVTLEMLSGEANLLHPKSAPTQ